MYYILLPTATVICFYLSEKSVSHLLYKENAYQHNVKQLTQLCNYVAM